MPLLLPFVMVALAFGAVGAVVASRTPGNPIGWLFLGLCAVEGAYELASSYAAYSVGVDALPADVWAAWFVDWSSVVPPALIGLCFLLFPDGRLLSSEWRVAAWVCALAILVLVPSSALSPGPLTDFPSLRNPAGIEALGFLRVTTDLAIGTVLVVGAVAVVARFRRSRGVERQQLKWFAWAAGVLAAFLLVAAAAEAVIGAAENPTVDAVGGLVFAVVLSALPVSAGIAILRHRLYDIDIVINRTLVYGALTILLAASYLGSVLAFRVLLDPVAGGSDLAVAGSTLAVAALFRPLREHVQAVVDRRFYRSRYDAAQTLDAFSGRLRDELDLESLATDLRRVIDETMRPAHVSLWLRISP